MTDRKKMVRIWYVVGDDIPTLARHDRLSGCLSDDEVRRAARFRLEDDHDRFVVGRILARLQLSSTGPEPPSEWRLVPDERGRPRLSTVPGRPSTSFNITHTEGLVACASTRAGDVGLDVEVEGSASDPMAVARRVFAPSEVAALEACPERERSRLFGRIWTLKEAFGKARGTGLAGDLTAFAFDLSRSSPCVTCDPEVEADPGAWLFREWRPTGRHSLSVAVRATAGRSLEFDLNRMSPDALVRRAADSGLL